jgi:segregation and condensation protein B
LNFDIISDLVLRILDFHSCMPSLSATLESLLFVSGHPLSEGVLARYAQSEPLAVRQALEELRVHFQNEGRGIQLLHNDGSWQLVSHPECAPQVLAFAKEEVLGELTRAQLETLAVLAYRGPIAKCDLDQIRGVNCRQILRNLLVRGLVESAGGDHGQDDGDDGSENYRVSPAFIRHLGLTALEDMPEYEQFRAASIVDDVVNREV